MYNGHKLNYDLVSKEPIKETLCNGQGRRKHSGYISVPLSFDHAVRAVTHSESVETYRLVVLRPGTLFSLALLRF